MFWTIRLKSLCEVFLDLGGKTFKLKFGHRGRHVSRYEVDIRYVDTEISREEIEKAAREHQATMIAIGSSSKAAWVVKWIGSIPKEIAEDSVYPTLIIPPEQNNAERAF